MEQNTPDWHRRGIYIPHRENKWFQTITFRLFDSLPLSTFRELRRELKSLQGGDLLDEARRKEILNTIAKYEDACLGSCFLRDSRIAKVIADALHYFDGERYRLIAYCIMPNHVHVLIEVSRNWTLSKIMHSWRSFTANQANKILNRSGQFWMEEYYDRYIRDGEHFANAISYIRRNPIKAGLVKNSEDWQWTWVIPNLDIFWDNGFLKRSLERDGEGGQASSLL